MTLTDDRISAMLGAARELFFEHSYDTISMDQIARRAGVSKATVYLHFRSKEHLLMELVRNEMKFLAIELPTASRSEPLDIESALRSIATQFIDVFMTDRALALRRLMATQAYRFPEIGRTFYEAGPKQIQNGVASLLRLAISQKVLSIPDVELASIQFLSLIRGDLPLNWALSLNPPSQEQLENLVEAGIRVFMAAYTVKQ